ncbi:hypothetical protein DM02DRAFT_710258 [Periconia macrospinosa]|uniref:Rhodopsin domain-containing protein n=1 Tax=Periconia macrospinosa TaxID=97972 RepID=A0A2V1DRL2_9PLEO|nr:hypothetical protein DM02DRAFT_710258 [Periconia macrospinosa]
MPGGFHLPLEFIASWPVPNYVNPVTRPMATSLIAGIFGPITLCLVFARLWVRLLMQRNGGLDDWLMIASVVSALFIKEFIAYTYSRSLCRHIWDVESSLYVLQRKLILAIELNFVIVTGLIKISVLLFYRRLGGRGVSKTFRIVTWTAIGSITASTTTFFLLSVLGCRPISAIWEQADPSKFLSAQRMDCLDEGAIVFSAGVVSTVQDFVTAILPTFIYWNTQIPFRQKVALFGIFATAYVVVAFGAMRTYATYVLFFKTYDISWQSWEVWNWTLLELYVGLICANSPALKIFFKQFLNLKTFNASRQQHPSKSRPNESQIRSTAANSRSSRLTFWKEPYANYGYHSQPTELSIDEHGGVYVKKSMDVEFPNRPYHVEEATDSIELDELGMLNNSATPHRQPVPPVPPLPQSVRLSRESRGWRLSANDPEGSIVGSGTPHDV